MRRFGGLPSHHHVNAHERDGEHTSISISGANMCNNCGIYDKGMKFGTKKGSTLRSIFGYSNIADSSSNRVKNMYMYMKLS